MFQFPGLASGPYVFSAGYPYGVGFPIQKSSDQSLFAGSPEAYRRLPRLSSPVAAKAFTMCAYSLDHITPSYPGYMELTWFLANATFPDRTHSHSVLLLKTDQRPIRSVLRLTLLFIRIVKERTPNSR